MTPNKTHHSKRDLNAILLLNKPQGLSSNAAMQRARRLYQAKKAGHTGTLDPLATGMLVVCFGKATKLCHYGLAQDKSYDVVATLGATTTTGDADGEILQQQPLPSLTTSELLSVIAPFRGTITQTPPMYSALKYQGKPLYELARAGIEVPRKQRQVTVHELILLDWSAPHLTLRVGCSKGTYIRSLVEDIGQQLGCGAHVKQLHRNWSGEFKAPHVMHTLDELQTSYDNNGLAAIDEWLLPMECLIPDWPAVYIAPEAMTAFCQGQAVAAASAPEQGLLRVHAADSRTLIGLATALGDGRITPKRILQHIA